MDALYESYILLLTSDIIISLIKTNGYFTSKASVNRTPRIKSAP